MPAPTSPELQGSARRTRDVAPQAISQAPAPGGELTLYDAEPNCSHCVLIADGEGNSVSLTLRGKYVGPLKDLIDQHSSGGLRYMGLAR